MNVRLLQLFQVIILQQEILELFILLDSVGVLHNDGNPLNLMWDETKHQGIDIDVKKLRE